MFIRFHQVAALALMLSTLSMADTESSKVLKVASYLSSHDIERTGTVSEMYDTIFEHLSVDYRLVSLPYRRSVQMATTGHIDAASFFEAHFEGRKLSATVPGVTVVPESQAEALTVLVGMKSRPLDKSLVKLGVPRNNPALQEFLNEGGYEVIRYENFHSLFRSLRAGRIDAVLIARFLFEKMSSVHDPDNEFSVVKVLGCTRSFLGYSNAALGEERAKNLAANHAAALRKIKATQPELLILDCPANL